MSDLIKEYIDITDQVKHLIEPKQIVFPSSYAELFSSIAHSKEIDITPEQLLTHEMLDERMVRYVVTLSECTEEALIAIETSNQEMLKTVMLKAKQLQEEVESLQKIVYEDTLTHTLNRKWFDDKLLDHSKIKLRESGRLVMVDLNRFKEINDTYGHIVGDKVLAFVALKLKELGGRVIRYGGDEFIIIFNIDMTPDIVCSKMDKLIHYFDKVHVKAGEHSFKVSFAYGLASFNTDHDVSTVIEEADRAMYLHKHKS